MPGSNPSIPGLDQNRLPGSLGGPSLNTWPSSTPMPQQPLPQIAPAVAPSSINSHQFGIPQVQANCSLPAPAVNSPSVSFNLRQEPTSSIPTKSYPVLHEELKSTGTYCWG